MALSEKRIIKQICVLPNSINVQWADQILRGDVVISEQYHRKAYTVEQAAEFAKEVENAQAYMAILGWEVPQS